MNISMISHREVGRMLERIRPAPAVEYNSSSREQISFLFSKCIKSECFLLECSADESPELLWRCLRALTVNPSLGIACFRETTGLIAVDCAFEAVQSLSAVTAPALKSALADQDILIFICELAEPYASLYGTDALARSVFRR